MPGYMLAHRYNPPLPGAVHGPRSALGYAYQFAGRKPSAWMMMPALCQELGKLSASGFGAHPLSITVLMSDGAHLFGPGLGAQHVDWWIQALCKKKLPKPLQASVSAIPQASAITPWIITTGNPDSTQTFVTEAAARERVGQILTLLHTPAPETFMMVKRGKAILGVWRGTGGGAGHWYGLSAYLWSKSDYYTPVSTPAHFPFEYPGIPVAPPVALCPPNHRLDASGHCVPVAAPFLYPGSMIAPQTQAPFTHLGAIAALGSQTPIPIGIGKCPPGTQYVWDPSINSYTCGYLGQPSP